nr:lipid phosphate phosphatase epsilon 2, chloroplastic [Tanacetum cinerariifolium]
MSRAALMPFATSPLPTLKHKCKCIDNFRTPVDSCPSFYTLKESAIAYKETVKHKKTMEVSELKLRLNCLQSKWIVSGTLCGIILLRRDSLALWAATGFDHFPLLTTIYTMASSAVELIINHPPTFKHCHNLSNLLRKTSFRRPFFHTLKESKYSYKKSFKLEQRTAAGSIGTGGDGEHTSPAISAFKRETLIDNDGASYQVTVGGLHSVFNRASKWVVAVTLSGLIFLRHDGLALWGATGSVLNYMLVIALKHILKQERPISDVNLGHGMPSSHAQNIFYTIFFVIMSVIEWQGLNSVTAVLSLLAAALGSYFSWLRVLLRYHTVSQVVVGAILGSLFSVVWFRSWETIVEKAFYSNISVRIFVVIGAACCCLELISSVLKQALGWTRSK